KNTARAGDRPGRTSRRAPLARQGVSHTFSPPTRSPRHEWRAPMSQPAASAVRLEFLDGPIAVLTLDQPGSPANTLGQAVLGELEGAVQQLAARTDLRGLVVRSGKPGMFIAGADIKEMAGARPDPETTRRLLKRGLDLVAAFEALPYPTVAAIEG